MWFQKLKDEASSGGSSLESTDTEDDEANLLRFFERSRTGHSADEMVVTAAKEMGKELYANLNPEERREKLDAMVRSKSCGTRSTGQKVTAVTG